MGGATGRLYAASDLPGPAGPRGSRRRRVHPGVPDDRRIEVVYDEPDYFFVASGSGVQLNRATVKFTKTGQCIALHCVRDDVEFYVKHRWDDDTDTCVLLVNGEPMDLWQISKKALSRLLFG